MSTPGSMEPRPGSSGGAGLPEDLSHDDIDALLRSNMMDTLVDFDFSYPDLSGIDTETKPLTSTASTLSPKPGSRKRGSPPPQACNWDGISPPKTVSEMNAGLQGETWETAHAQAQAQAQAQALTQASPPPAGAAGAGATTPAGQPLGPAACGAGSNHTYVSASLRGRCYADSKAAPTTATGSKAPPPADSKRAGGATHQEAPPPGAEGTVAPHGKAAGNGGGGGSGGGGGGGQKGRRGAGGGGGGGGKRPLNPDRMERKASREKRRREEVNEKFEQLQQVLEEAETTSGLEPPLPTEGQAAANACINGRRVEVLSRTIVVLNKLLRDRLAAASSSSSSPPSCSSAAVSDGVKEETPASLSASAAAAAAAAAAAVAATSTADATTATTAAPVPHCIASSCCTHSAEATAACVTPGAAAAVPATTAAKETTAPSLVHPMALHGHPPVSVPAGFPGLPAGMQAGIAHGIAGHGLSGHGQPIFIAVPVYMPQGQGMGSAEGSVQAGAPPASPAVPAAATAATATAATAATATATAAAAAAPAPSAAPEVVTSGAPPAKPESMPSAAGKEAWAVHPSMAFQSMMTLQMPQFVAQALSTEEGDEKPTHAVCA